MKLQRYDIRWQSDQYVLAQSSNGEWCRSAEAARLEASHADLLETVKGFLRWWDSPLTGNWGHIDRLRAAIAKAERSEDEPITDDKEQQP